MPRPPDSNYVIWGSAKDPNRDPAKVMRSVKPEIGRSVLAVTIGERLKKRCPPVNVKGDRPED